MLVAEYKGLLYSGSVINPAYGFGIKIHIGGALKHPFKSVKKFVGKTIHKTGKAVGSGIKTVGHLIEEAKPILVPLAVGSLAVAGLGYLSSAFANTTVGTIASSVAKGIGASVASGVALASKVAITTLTNQLILKALYSARGNQYAVVKAGNKPALVIPPILKEIYPPDKLVALITVNGRVKNSKDIQRNVDLIMQQLDYFVKQLAKINRECGGQIDRNTAIRLIKETFNKATNIYILPRVVSSALFSIRSKYCNYRPIPKPQQQTSYNNQINSQPQTTYTTNASSYQPSLLPQARSIPQPQPPQAPQTANLINIGGIKITPQMAIMGGLLLILLLTRR